jgi:Flp pilus assembly protein TadB
MEALFHFSTLLLLFGLLFLSIRHGLLLADRRIRFRRRLSGAARRSEASGQSEAIGRYGAAGRPEVPAPLPGAALPAGSAARPRMLRALIRQLALMLEAIQWKMRPGQFLGLSLLFGLLGMWIGLVLFSTFKGVATLGLMFALGPFLRAAGRLIRKQALYRQEFLPAVEVFYQCYTLSGGKNLRAALRETLEGSRIGYPIRPVFEQLSRNLLTSRDADESFQLFVIALGHRWARYFANILSVAHHEGIDVTRALEELINDMRDSQKAALVERNRLLEIRMANFSPILFLVMFLAVNFHLDPALAYQYYFVDPAGRNMLLEAMVLIVASFLMGIYLSMKRN